MNAPAGCFIGQICDGFALSPTKAKLADLPLARRYPFSERAWVGVSVEQVGDWHDLGGWWANQGIHVNAIAPGYIENIMAGVTYHPDDPCQQRAIERTPMGQRGRLHEFVGAYLFLASEAASYITGTALYVDGGFRAAWCSCL